MKKTLLFTCLMASTLTYSQKILNALVEKSFNEQGGVEYVDSSVYNYVTVNHYLNELKPKFGYDGDILYYFMEDLFIHCDSINEFGGMTYPLSPVGTTNNTLTNAMVTLSEYDGSSGRRLFEYDGQGRKISEVFQFFDGTNWNSNDSSVFAYDALDNLVFEADYSVSGNLYTLENVDSLSYQPGTSNLTQSSYYIYDGTSLVLDYQTTVTYSGSEIDYLDISGDDGSTGFNWLFRLDYLYTANELVGFDAYEITNNVLPSTPSIEGIFTYNTQNEIESYTLTEGSDLLEKKVFNYDTDGFISKVDNFEDGNSGIYLAWEVTYYYTDVASVKTFDDHYQVSIFPNPTTDVLNILSDDLIDQVQVIDMQGNIVLIQNNTVNIDVSHLSNGTYFIRGNTNGNQKFSQPFIKQ